MVFLVLFRNKFNCEVLFDIVVYYVILGFKLFCCRYNFGDVERYFLWIYFWYEFDIGWLILIGCLVFCLDSFVYICVMGIINRSLGYYIYVIDIFFFLCLFINILKVKLI